MPALWRPYVKAANDKEGLLKVNRVRISTDLGVDKRLKIIVSIISFKKSKNTKSELDLNSEFIE